MPPTLPNLVSMGIDSGRTSEPPPTFDDRSAVPLHDRMEAWVAGRVTETGRPDPIMEYHIGMDKKIGSVARAREMQARSDARATPDGKAS